MQNFFTSELGENSYGVVKGLSTKNMRTEQYKQALKELTQDGRYVIYMPFLFNKENICTRAGFLYQNGKKVNVPEFQGMCQS